MAPQILSSPRREVVNSMRGLVQAAVSSAATAGGTQDLGVRGPRITSLPPGVTSGVAGPVVLNDGVPVLQKRIELDSDSKPMITPPIKPAIGKGLLPYNVTPPRPSVFILVLFF